MSIALVANVGAGSSNGSTVTTGAIDTSGANLIVLQTGTSSSTAPTDSKGNTYTNVRTQTGDFSGHADLWYCLNPIVGSGHTFSLSDNSPAISAAAFSGVATSGALDQQNGANLQNSGGQPGSITPSVNDALVVVGLGGFYTNSSVAVSGYTTTDAVLGVGGVSWGTLLAYAVQGTATATNPTFSNVGNNVGAIIASFKPATGASPISGTATITLGALTSTATGTLPIVGSSTVTLGALTSTATGVLPIKGQSTVTLGAVTSTATGVLAVVGQATVTLGALASTATGALAVVGQSTVTLGALTVVAVGGSGLAGTLSVTLGALTSTAAGVLPLLASATVTLGALTSTATGLLPLLGTVTVTLGSLTLVGVGADPSVVHLRAVVAMRAKGTRIQALSAAVCRVITGRAASTRIHSLRAEF